MRTLWQDVRYGVRMLGRNPGLMVAAVLCLGLGIGATTTIFSVVDGALLRPFPYEKPDELARIWQQRRDDSPHKAGLISYPNWLDCKNSSRAFRDMAIVQGVSTYPMRYGDLFEPAQALEVTSNVFDVLGVRPVLGRPFLPEDEKKGQQHVAILTDGCWRNWFQADPNVLGESMTLRLYGEGETSFTIVGVLPPSFIPPVDFPLKPDLLIPFPYDEAQASRDALRCSVVARLRAGVTLREAQTELDLISRRLAQDYPKENAGLRLLTKPLRSDYSGAAGPVLYLLLGASGLLLVVACVNVADLLLIRGLQRQREIAVRAALGAGRLRVLRQLAVEGLLVALLGLLVGIVISLLGLGLLRPLILSRVPVVGGLKVDLKALAFAAAVALATGAIFGLVPALSAWRIDLATAFRGDAAHATTGRQTRRTHSLLAASQIALAFLLLVGAGLAVRTVSNLLHIDPGFNPRPVLALEATLPLAKALPRGGWDDSRLEAFRNEFLTQVRHLPGVTAAAISDGLPLWDSGANFPFDIEGDPAPPKDGYHVRSTWVSTEYFRTVGARLLRGRDFRETDRLTSDSERMVVIVNRALAERLWPSQDPIGRRLKDRGGRDVYYEIIGVVENECYFSDYLTRQQDIPPRAYFNRYPAGRVNVTVRTEGDPLALAPAVKSLIRRLDDQVLVGSIRPMENDLQKEFQLQQMTMLLVGVFAIFAFALSIVGLYGVMAHASRSRFKEMAIRMATGARPADILGMVLKQGATVVGMGMGVGLFGVFALARVAASYVYGVAPTDGLTVGGAVLLLGVASFMACSLPARRAARIDPMTVLRYE